MSDSRAQSDDTTAQCPVEGCNGTPEPTPDEPDVEYFCVYCGNLFDDQMEVV